MSEATQAPEKKFNPFAKNVRRYVERPRWYGGSTVHGMIYHRDARIWLLRCRQAETWAFPRGGSMISMFDDQPNINCKDCLNTLGADNEVGGP